MSVLVTRTSRLRFAELLDAEDGRQFFDVPSFPTLEPQSDDLLHVVQGNERPDAIAYTYYKNPALQYVIALANDIELWPVGISPGMVLRIPSPRYVLQVWLPSATTQRR